MRAAINSPSLSIDTMDYQAECQFALEPSIQGLIKKNMPAGTASRPHSPSWRSPANISPICYRRSQRRTNAPTPECILPPGRISARVLLIFIPTHRSLGWRRLNASTAGA